IASRMWQETGALTVLVPEIADVSVESVRALDHAALPGLPRRPGRRLVRFAVLFSGVAPDQVFRAATRLRFSKHDAQWIQTIVGHWQSVSPTLADGLVRGDLDGAAVRRLIARVGRLQLGAFFRVSSAKWRGQGEFT